MWGFWGMIPKDSIYYAADGTRFSSVIARNYYDRKLEKKKKQEDKKKSSWLLFIIFIQIKVWLFN